MASVTFEHVKKQYGNLAPVINDLNLGIHNKEFLVLVGPSGCGKSTALRMIAGLEEISGGALKIGERVVNDVHPKDRDIAMVFQNYALYPHMTCRENMAFALKLKGVDKRGIDARVSQAAKALAIDHLLDRKPKALSGGQRQRIAIGRAVVREPQVFLMDEPLSNLDAKLRVSMRAEIKRLHHRLKTTFVYVTHDQTEAMTLGDRICVLKAGDIMQCDTPHVLYNEPANLFVATFIGSPQMNILDAELTRDGDSSRLTGDGFRFTVPKRSSHRDGPVKIGVRPEHLHLVSAEEAKNEAHRLTSTVEVTEPMGFETYVSLRTASGSEDKHAVVARIPEEHTPSIDATVSFTVEASKVHLFDATSGERLA
jgi:multiple sugar transport system ATP-binding protein